MFGWFVIHGNMVLYSVFELIHVTSIVTLHVRPRGFILRHAADPQLMTVVPNLLADLQVTQEVIETVAGEPELLASHLQQVYLLIRRRRLEARKSPQ